jgi:hypothetical protein
MRPLLIPTFLVALTACATHSPAPLNTDFSPPPVAEIARGFELRSRYNLPTHIGATAIFVDSVAVHHVYTEVSTVAWRDEAGHWQWNQAMEVGPGGLLSIDRSLDANETRTLTDAEAQALERLIRNPELYRGEVHRTGQIGVGAAFHVMAIVTPFGRTTVRWDGRLRGPSGSIADIILGRE